MNSKIYYGTETEKAIRNFGTGCTPEGLITAYAEVKEACICAIQERENHFPDNVYTSVLEAIGEIKSGLHYGQFPLPLKQGGAGTSLNMNMNEVIASRSMAILKEKKQPLTMIDPIEDINRYQSTNDTFPTALTVYFLRRLHAFENKVIKMQEVLVEKETGYQNQLLAGRTEMQSALPVTLGQVFSSWAGMTERDRWRLHKIRERFRTVALGGTAIGTGFSAPQSYIFLAEKHLRTITNLPLSRSQNLTDEIAHSDKFTELANGISQFSENIFKITGDLLIYTSSVTGEIIHPNLQYGSSIMPAKINPVILEYAKGHAINACHECAKVREYAKSSQLQLNPFLPFLADALNRAFDSTENAAKGLLEHFFPGMGVNSARMEENLVRSEVLFNALLPLLGYHRVKKLSADMNFNRPLNLNDFRRKVAEMTGTDEKILEKYLEPVQLTTAMRG